MPAPSASIRDSLATARPGDVILITPCDAISCDPLHAVPLAKLIREVTQAPVSHSLVVIGGGRFVDIRASRRPALAEGPLEQLGGMKELRGCWLLRHTSSNGPGRATFEKAVTDSVAAVLNSPEPIEFATGELVKGLLLLLARREGPEVIARLGLRKKLRRLISESPNRMFCSELTYRAFATAADSTGVAAYGIDCSDMLLRDWFVLLDAVTEGEAPPTITVETGSPIARLAASGQLQGFPWTIEEIDSPASRVSSFHMDPTFDADAASFLYAVRKAGVSRRARGEIADYITPRDLLYSPSLVPVARWGLGLNEELDPWLCP